MSLTTVTFEDWTARRTLPNIGTNSGALQLPFQNWQHFKEAFAPELIERAVSESTIPVRSCIDPFGGSGTTGLACQFLGVKPSLIEVNPYLADLIDAKLTTYDADELARSLGKVIKQVRKPRKLASTALNWLPPTFVEPGVKQRWIFDSIVATRLTELLDAIDGLSKLTHRKLFRVLLGGMLVDVSNIRVSGKGRRYRNNWEQRNIDSKVVDKIFCDRVEKAISEIHRFAGRGCSEYDLFRGDCRTELRREHAFDLAVFSPPYANSFDYTDVYNVQLWFLRYIVNSTDNRVLRSSTLSSHVQVARNFTPAPKKSLLLNHTLARLEEKQAELWDGRIPEMVGGYFADMSHVLRSLAASLKKRADLWMVVGDSRYAGIHIPVAKILLELAPKTTWRTVSMEPFRSMRSSPQQGGQEELAETLVILRKR